MLNARSVRIASLVLPLLVMATATMTEARTWKNKSISFSIEYPDWVTAQLDEAALKEAMKAGQELLDGDFTGLDAGQQFMFFLDPPGSKPVVSNLGLSTSAGIKRPRGMSPEEFCSSAIEGFPTVLPGALQLAPVGSLELGGKIWYTADFKFVTQGLQLTARTIVHHVKKTMYTLTFVDESATFDDNVTRIDPILATIKFGR